MIGFILSLIVAQVQAGLTRDLHSQPPTDWEIRLFPEDHVVESGQGLAMVVQLHNRADHIAHIKRGAAIKRVATPATKPTTGATQDQVELPARLNKADATEGALPYILVIIEGPFNVPLRPLLGVRSDRVDSVELEPNQIEYSVAALPRRALTAGDYKLWAVIYTGETELATSKVHRIKVSPERVGR